MQAAGLNRHSTIHSDDKPYTCEICNKTFKLSDSYNIHKRTHTKERPYKCLQCDKTYTNYSGLNKHLRAHTGVKEYQCAQCGKSFGRNDILIEHMKLHSGERPFTCETCGTSFTSKSTLKVHIRVHTLEKPYSCKFCSKSFSQSSVLNRHLRTHTGERPFKCNLCNLTFALKVRLDTHYRNMHNDNFVKPSNFHLNNTVSNSTENGGNLSTACSNVTTPSFTNNYDNSIIVSSGNQINNFTIGNNSDGNTSNICIKQNVMNSNDMMNGNFSYLSNVDAKNLSSIPCAHVHKLNNQEQHYHRPTDVMKIGPHNPHYHHHQYYSVVHHL